MKGKIRLDNYLLEKKLSRSIDKAKSEIIAGWVKVDGETIREPSRTITGKELIQVARPGGRYVSRGGEKLRHALDYFQIEIRDKITADLGASTGGFTDCMLQAGAKKVYSIDVGYGLLDYKLRNDPRVIIKERKNVKDLKREDFEDKIDFIAVDLSFISILNAVDGIKNTFSEISGVILLKPQFEAKPGEHKKGVVKEKQYHINILKRVLDSLSKKGMIFKGMHFSPLKGPAGNIEFLLYFNFIGSHKIVQESDFIDVLIEKTVNEAHNKLNLKSNL